MPLGFQEIKGNIVIVTASGKLTDDDYAQFVPHMQTLIERWGRLRMLFRLDESFSGWDVQGMWTELRFQAKHREDIKRVAVVGTSAWQKLATQFSKVFTGTDVRFFNRDEEAAAREWIEAGW